MVFWLLFWRDGFGIFIILGIGVIFIWNSFVYMLKWGVFCFKKVSLWNRVFELVCFGVVCLGKCVNILNVKFFFFNVDCKYILYKYYDKKGFVLKNIWI